MNFTKLFCGEGGNSISHRKRYTPALSRNSSRRHRTFLSIEVSTTHGVKDSYGRRWIDPVRIDDLGSLHGHQICPVGSDHSGDSHGQHCGDFRNCFQPLNRFRFTQYFGPRSALEQSPLRHLCGDFGVLRVIEEGVFKLSVGALIFTDGLVG